MTTSVGFLRGLEAITEGPRLSRLYNEAVSLSDLGQWMLARDQFRSIAAIRKGFRDVDERLRPLEKLTDALEANVSLRGSIATVARRVPLIGLLITGLFPNLLAASFNYAYNWRTVAEPMLDRGVVDALQRFDSASLIVNVLGFSLGTLGFVILARTVTRALGDPNLAGPSGASLADVRIHAIHLGHLAALLGALLWLVAGPTYPILIGAMGLDDYAFFVISLLFCGLIASTYPFFGVTWACTRLHLPRLLTAGSGLPRERAELDRLERRSWIYLVLAGALPMLAIAAGLVLSPFHPNQIHGALLGILGFAGFAGFIIAIGLFRAIQADIALLAELLARCTPAAQAPADKTLR